MSKTPSTFCPYKCLREIISGEDSCECGGTIIWAEVSGNLHPITTEQARLLVNAGAKVGQYPTDKPKD